MAVIKSGLVVHVHHKDKLFEFCYDYGRRVNVIETTKSTKEIPLRLRLLRIVAEDRIPGRDSPEWQLCQKTGIVCQEAWEVSQEAWKTYKAGVVCQKAEKAYQKTWEVSQEAEEAYLVKYASELEALHKEICPDCPWDGQTIFTRKNEKGEWY